MLLQLIAVCVSFLGWARAVNAALAGVHANHWQATDLCICGAKGSLHFLKKKTLNP